MAGASNDSEDMITGINITPMVDVMLVLLVIFMISAPALYQGGIKIDLPAAKSGEAIERVTLKFVLDPEGKITLDEKEIKFDQIAEITVKALKIDPNADAVIAADGSIPHRRVVQVIDQLKLAGIQRFAVAVAGSEDPSQKKPSK